MTSPHYARSRARRPSISLSDEVDVEPDDVVLDAATHLLSDMPSPSTPVRSRDEAVRGPESVSAEPAGSVPAPATPSPEETPLPMAGPVLQDLQVPSSRGLP